MSCSKQCFDPKDKWHSHENCQTCIGQDSGPSKEEQKYCAACNDWHSMDEWPHAPQAEHSNKVIVTGIDMANGPDESVYCDVEHDKATGIMTVVAVGKLIDGDQ